MVNNSTWAGMIAMKMRYDVFCEACDRSVEIDMMTLPPDGKAIDASFRCSRCGQLGRSIVSHRSANHMYPGAKPPALR